MKDVRKTFSSCAPRYRQRARTAGIARAQPRHGNQRNGNNISAMPRPRPVRFRAWAARAAAAAAAGLAVAMAGGPAALALGTAGRAAAGAAVSSAGAASPAGAAAGARQLPVSLAITAISPGYVTPGKPVTVSGSVTNTSRTPITGMTVRLRSARTPFASRGGMQVYADGTTIADSPVAGAVTSIPGTLAPHATATWSIPLRAGQLGLADFGVYPLAAEADNAASTPLETNRTFLPFWPGKRVLDPVRQPLAWVWPLISQPQQSPCQGLLNNNLATSLGTGGRLAGLLAAGRLYAAGAHLTWAIDPALLASAQTMTRPYQFGASTNCADPRQRPASQAAVAWLAGLKSTTAGQPVLVTPFADVDVAALSHHGLDDLASAFAAGRSTATSILGRNFSAAVAAASGGGTSQQLTGTAWPADGIANYGVLNSLAVRGISTVVLDSATMPPSPSQTFTPSAVTTTPSGVGPRMHVLLADDTITQVLGTANRHTAPPSSSFAVAQRFLAETAMIAAERPSVARSVVVAPPRHWDPPPGLAGQLLAETVSAPWIRPESLPGLAAADSGAGQVHRQLLQMTSKNELRGTLLHKIRQLDRGAALLQSIRVRKDQGLSTAIMAAESSQWRGGGARARRARELVRRISSYLSRQQSSVVIIGPDRVTLGGLSGTLPVSVSNGLRYPVRVRLAVTVPGDKRITVSAPPPVIKLKAGAERTLKLHVRAATVGSTTIRLSLLTPDGAPLPGRPVELTVQATHFGTLALVIIGAALGVFVLTSIRRALTRGRGDQAGSGGADPEGADTGADTPDPPGVTERADNVVTDRADDKHPPEDPDEYASAPGRTDRR